MSNSYPSASHDDILAAVDCNVICSWFLTNVKHNTECRFPYSCASHEGILYNADVGYDVIFIDFDPIEMLYQM